MDQLTAALVMNDLTTKYLFLPLFVAILGGFIVWWLKNARQRSAVRQMLISEINLLINEFSDNTDYLSRRTHDWLKEGTVLNEAPVFAETPRKMWTAVLPMLWFLPNEELRKVLLFYTHIERCEQLIQILFSRIQEQQESNQALTKDQVERNQVRLDRILGGCRSAINITNRRIEKLGDLPATYSLATAECTAENLADAETTANR
jgi:hypothetical protein